MLEASRRGVLRLIGSAAGLAAAPAAGSHAAGVLIAGDLRVDFRSGPAGVEGRRLGFGWRLAARDPHRRGLVQSACRLVVDEAFPGKRAIYDSGRIDSAALSFTPDADLPLAPQTPYRWRVRPWDQDGLACGWSAPAPFVTGVGGPWRGAWIAAEPDGVITAPATENDDQAPQAPSYRLPLLRRDFTLDGPVRHAVICLSGLGAHSLTINGRDASAAVMNPGWTDYHKTVLYETLDVTRLLRRGRNVIGVRLGGGFYDVQARPGRYGKFAASFGAPKLMLQLRVLHEDGREAWIVSDEDWRWTPGPVGFASIYGGEDCDGGREPKGWDRPGFHAGWAPVVLTTGPGGRLAPQMTPGLEIAETLPAVHVGDPADGIALYDLGRNMSGFPLVTVQGPAGAEITLTPGELLDGRGRVSQASMGADEHEAIRFTYRLDESGMPQRWRPRFSYTGFRYVEVAGSAKILDLQGAFVHAAAPEVGSFTCGDPRLVAIRDLIRRAVLSNLASVITDCPHREKLGWLEQTWLNAVTVFGFVDALPLYDKLVGDIADAQGPDGMVPSIAPEYIRFVDQSGRNTDFRDSPEWGSAAVQSPWAAYRFSGDIGLLRRAWPAMRRYTDYLAKRAGDGLLDFGLGDWYDIGPLPPGPAQLTSRAFTATAVWYDDLRVMAKVAALLGFADEGGWLAAKAAGVKAAFNRRLFSKADGHYGAASQTANAMALALDLAPESARPSVLAALVAAVHARQDHVSAGDIGFHYVVRALAREGRGDLLHDMLVKDDPPSYGAQLRRGATTLTEAWDARPQSSQNHLMLGHAALWLFEGLAGFDIDFSRGTERALRVAPQPLAAIGHVDARYKSVLGEIGSAWRIADGRIRLWIEAPPGGRISVRLPGRPLADWREGGRRLTGRDDIGKIRASAGAVEIILGSGFYDFTAPWPPA